MGSESEARSLAEFRAATPHFIVNGWLAIERDQVDLDALSPEELATYAPVTCQYLIDGGSPHVDHA